MRWLAIIALVVMLAPGPATAEPITTAIGVISTFFASGTVAAFAARIGLTLLLSTLQAAKARKTPASSFGGIRTESTTSGGITSMSTIVGRYATEGNLTEPMRAHGVGAGGVLTSLAESKPYRTIVIDIGDVPIDGIESIYINDARYDIATHFAGPVHPKYGMSLTPGIGLDKVGLIWLKTYDGRQTVADPYMLEAYGDHPQRPYTSDMILRGIPYLILTLLYDQTRMNSDPRIRVVARGMRLYDPRLDSTVGGSGLVRWNDAATWLWTENPLVIAYNIMRGITVQDGVVWGCKVPASMPPLNNWMAAMNACPPNTGAGDHFIAGYEIKFAEDDPLAVVGEILNAAGAEFADTGTELLVRVGGPGLPVMFITDADILCSRSAEMDPFPPRAETFNAIHGTYPSPYHKWAPKEAPPRFDPDAEAEDGERLPLIMRYPAAPNANQVIRLMKAGLKDARRLRRHQNWLPPQATSLKPLQSVSWTSARNGYAGEVFEVQEQTIDPASLAVDNYMRERNSGDFIVTAEDLPTPPSEDIVYLPPLVLPGFNATGWPVLDASGNFRRPGMRLTWTALPEVAAISYEVRIKATAVDVTNGTTSRVLAEKLQTSDGLLADVIYEARAIGKVTTARQIAWTPWVEFTTPDIRLKPYDFDPSVEQTLILPQRLTLAQTAEALLTDFVQGWDRDTTNTVASDTAHASIRQQELLRVSGDAALAQSIVTLSADLGAVGASVSVTQSALATLTGAVGNYVIRVDAGGASGVFRVYATDDLVTPLSGVLIDTDVFHVQSDLTLFGGVLQSSDFVAGESGWQITDAGDAEVNSLIVRADMLGADVEQTLILPQRLTLAQTAEALLTDFVQGWDRDTTNTVASDTAHASIRQQELLRVSGDAALAQSIVTLSADLGAVGASVSVTQSALATLTGAVGDYVIRVDAGGASGVFRVYAIDNLVTPLSGVLIDTDVFHVQSDLTLFGGVLQSSDFVAGESGWQITDAGDAEVNSLIVRADMVDGSIYEEYLDVVPTLALTGTGTFVTTMFLTLAADGYGNYDAGFTLASGLSAKSFDWQVIGKFDYVGSLEFVLGAGSATTVFGGAASPTCRSYISFSQFNYRNFDIVFVQIKTDSPMTLEDGVLRILRTKTP